MLGVSPLEEVGITCNFVPGTRTTQQGINEKCAGAEPGF